VKNDSKLVAAVHDLRDRQLAQVNSNPSALTSSGKYDVSRALEGPSKTVKVNPAPASPKQLPEAA
jgi:hypothetical protein